MLDRHQARILTMQALCQFDTLDKDFLSQIDEFLADESPPTTVQRYARNLFRDAHTNRTAIDEHIQSAGSHWDIGRMTTVDRNILRTAVCELLHRTDVPAKVVINEAILIAKEFGAVESPAFVNGVLDAISKRE